MNRSAIFVVVLLVSSMIAPTGLAQTATETPTPTETADKTTYTFTGGGEILVVDTTNMSGTVTVTWSTRGTPGSGETILAREDVDTTQTDGQAFGNSGAYDRVNVTVEGTGSDSVETHVYGGRSLTPNRYDVIGGTGGDKDLTCDYIEQAGRLLDPGYTQFDCTAPVSSNSINTTSTDAEQVELDIYRSAQEQRAESDIDHASLNNTLEDTVTQARIVGKNAYIRALNNGSSEAVARSQAKQAVRDYYSVRQANLAKQFGVSVAQASYLRGVAANESGLSTSYVDLDSEPNDSGYGYIYDGVDHQPVTLANGSTMDHLAVNITHTGGNFDNNYEYITVNNGKPDDISSNAVPPENMVVQPPTSNHDALNMMDFSIYRHNWNALEAQTETVVADMDVIVNNTYDAYQAGEINNSDLVDPYLFAQEFSPGDEYQGWAAAQLTMLGTNSPEAMDSIGRFNVSAESGEYSGILMSQTNPASGQFETNTTYDPSQIDGTQYVVTESQVHELTTNFTIESIETTDGQQVQNVTIEKTTYKTADVNTTQLKQTYENLRYLREQYEAREQALGGGSGGGFFGGGSIDRTVALLALAALAGAALLGKS